MAVLVLVVGAVGRITYEQVFTKDTPAYAQDTSSPAPTTSSPAPTTTSSPAPTTTSSPAPSDTGASQDQYDDGSGDRPGDLMKSGASGPGPVLTLPDGSCIPDYPNKRN